MNNVLNVLKVSSNIKNTESNDYSKLSDRSRKEENFKNVLTKAQKHNLNDKENNEKFAEVNNVNEHDQNKADDKLTLKTKECENSNKENLEKVDSSKDLNENNKITEKKANVLEEDGNEQMILPEGIENLVGQKIEKIFELILSEDSSLSLDSIDSEKLKELCSTLMNELNLDLVGDNDKLEPSIMNKLTEVIKTLSEDEKGLLNNLFKDFESSKNINLSDSNEEIYNSEAIKEISKDLTENIIKELKTKLNHSTENIDNKVSDNVQDKLRTDNINNLFTNAQSNSDSTDSNHSNEFLDKESKILNNLIGKEDNCDKQISKVTNFMTQFIEAKDGVNEIANVDAASNITVNRNNFTGDIIKAVKFMSLNGMKDLTVKVVPKELGEVIINLTMESGIMKANISSTNKETVNILNANLHDINEKLNNSDIKIQNVTIDIYNDDTTFYSDQFAKNGSSHNNKKGNKKESLSVDAIESEKTAENDYEADGNVNILA